MSHTQRFSLSRSGGPGETFSLTASGQLPASALLWTVASQSKSILRIKCRPPERAGCCVSVARVRWPSVHSDAKIFLMPKRHANSPWASGVSVKLPPAGHSQFERYARKLSLTEQDYANSAELRRWCAANRNRCYIPEWLLMEWNMYVEPELS